MPLRNRGAVGERSTSPGRMHPVLAVVCFGFAYASGVIMLDMLISRFLPKAHALEMRYAPVLVEVENMPGAVGHEELLAALALDGAMLDRSDYKLRQIRLSLYSEHVPRDTASPMAG